MTLPANTSRFEFAIAGVDSEVRVVRFSGQEELSRPFVFRLELASEDHAIEFAQVVDHSAVLGIVRDGDMRYVNGIVSRFEQGEIGTRFALYHVELVPKIWRLAYRHNCRIFQDKTAPAIIKQILTEVGLGGDEYRQVLQGQHPTREYCVQYRESELDFISRLMEEEGIFYYFEHADDKHVMVMADTSSVHPAVSGDGKARYIPRQAGLVSEEHVFAFRYAEEIRPGVSTLRDFNFKKPAQDLDGTFRADQDARLEYYDYPGRYDESGVGAALAKVRLQELRVPRKTGAGAGVCANFLPGYTVTLKEFPRDSLNIKYLLVGVITEAAQPQALEETAGDGGTEFSNTFTCIPFTVPYRAPRLTTKPFVKGSQTAIVVGPPGEEIYTDTYGRIKVQFHWDREGQRNERSSCWIRTSQAWAGAAWGAMSIPRIGHEVIVDFLEGDPDRPIITGRVYHGTNRPPDALPANKTRTTLKTNSSKGGGGSNELRFEDRKNQEQIYLHAQKDQDNVVEHDETTKVGHDRTETVGNDETTRIGHDRTETVGNDETIAIGMSRTETVGHNEQVSITLMRTHSVGVNDMLNVGAAQEITVGGAQVVSVGLARALSVGLNHITNVGKHLSITAGDSVSIVTGKASITMNKDGTIVITGTDISITGSGNLSAKASKAVVIKGQTISEN